MKTLMTRSLALIVALPLSCSMALAGPWEHRGPYPGGGGHEHHHGGGAGRWIAPLVIGTALGYAITRPAVAAPVVVEPAILPPPVMLPPAQYGAPVQVWPAPPYGYRYEDILDGRCNCVRRVLVPI